MNATSVYFFPVDINIIILVRDPDWRRTRTSEYRYETRTMTADQIKNALIPSNLSESFNNLSHLNLDRFVNFATLRKILKDSQADRSPRLQKRRPSQERQSSKGQWVKLFLRQKRRNNQKGRKNSRSLRTRTRTQKWADMNESPCQTLHDIPQRH